MIGDPAELKAMNGEGFVFSPGGGLTPVCRKVMHEDFHPERMTEWYLHFDPNEFDRVREVQEGLLEGEEPACGKARCGGAALPFPAQENMDKRKRA
jgi:hypothetical protein